MFSACVFQFSDLLTVEGHYSVSASRGVCHRTQEEKKRGDNTNALNLKAKRNFFMQVGKEISLRK